jgi:hypothetical protein
MTRRQMTMIANNVVKVVRKGDTNLLTKQSYNYLYLCSGFIAHYNLFGFRDAYEGGHSLGRAIMNNRRNNQWGNFRPGEQNYDYYMAKKECYNLICKGLEDAGYPDRMGDGEWI